MNYDMKNCFYIYVSDHFFYFFLVSSERPYTSIIIATPAKIHFRGG